MARQLIMENNDESYMVGDAGTIKMIFNNLTGKNIVGLDYDLYVDQMKKQTGLKSGTLKVYYKTLLLEGTVK